MNNIQLGYYFLGGCYSVCDRSRNYDQIALVLSNRTVKFLKKNLPNDIQQKILHFAATDDSNTSVTQSQKIFDSRPGNNAV